jgi:hypothetical protein
MFYEIGPNSKSHKITYAHKTLVVEHLEVDSFFSVISKRFILQKSVSKFDPKVRSML